MIIKAKKDIWITIGIVWIVMTLIVSIFIVPAEQRGIMLIMVIPVGLFLGWLYFGTYYVFKENLLYCRSGPFVEKIPYDNIRALKLCKNMMSSMALSRERIEIKQHGKGYVHATTYISPIHREPFLEVLKQRCHVLD